MKILIAIYSLYQNSLNYIVTVYKFSLYALRLPKMLREA